MATGDAPVTGEALDARVVVPRHGLVLDATVVAAPGEVVAVMGPSGAGKSTLLGAIAGLVPLGEGHVRVGGRTLDAAPRPRAHVTPSKRGVVLLGQDPRVFPHLTAHQNVAFGPLARGVDKPTAHREADEWLSRVGLDGMGARRPAQLSGGQQQRVAIARALATAPSLLLLDEPLTSLDTETAADIRAMVREQLTATRTTAVVATHNAVDSVSLADRLVVVEDGRVTQAGPVRDVLAAPATRFVAAVSGLNRVVGTLASDRWASGGLVLDAGRGDAGEEGRLAAVFSPAAVRLERIDGASESGAVPPEASDGSPRDAGKWLARVVRLEQTPAGVRVRTAEPEVAVDLPADRAAEAALVPGAPVRLRVDAGDVRFIPA
ncbi:ABC transporter ATP-binding protein [Microbacterium sp. 4R-513]|uniref:sulfate/molybdate ABC transporter ATP-binding protein n=1 Tax=Microbacterium sp. 4R-513 TaxID=2567934 RepID=UPI0013E19259|nr:ABC transporter ATP-binding protein [Microbacterium sp. 4R-513]QIG39860.1 ABC transporter ATP-binding protein [Microbacterium sp. 4R-513]